MGNINYLATICKYEQGICCGDVGTSGYCADCPFDYSKQQLTYSPVWQLCPKCAGSGRAMNYDLQIPTTWDTCDVCNGKKIISTITGQPPA